MSIAFVIRVFAAACFAAALVFDPYAGRLNSAGLFLLTVSFMVGGA